MSIWIKAAQHVNERIAGCGAIALALRDVKRSDDYWDVQADFRKWFRSPDSPVYWWSVSYRRDGSDINMTQAQQDKRVFALLLMHHIMKDE